MARLLALMLAFGLGVVLLGFFAAGDGLADAIDAHEEKMTPATRAVFRGAPQADHDVLYRTETGEIVVERATPAAIQGILNNPLVELVEIDQEVGVLADWNVERVGAPAVWNLTTGDGVDVAVIDTGMLGGSGWNVLANDSNVTDTHGHGTNVAGVVVAVSPDADIMAVKVLSSGSGQLSDLIAGIDWAVDNGAEIIVLSLEMEGYSQIMRDMLDEAYDDGVLIVGASGNDGSDVVYPAAYDDVIAVGAIDENDDLTSFSNYGFEQELVAPGVEVNTTGLSGYELVSGTSVAAPHVAGVAALLREWNDSLSNEEVRGLLQNTAEDLGDAGWDEEFGYGVVQATLSGSTEVGNMSYFYEIYNISEYGTENETHAFWLNGTGSFEDVNFSEGYYLVTRWVPEPENIWLFVAENGTIQILTSSAIYSDDYFSYGSSSDGKIWEGGDISYTCTSCSSDLVNCFETNSGGVFNFNSNVECYADNALDLGFCRAQDSNLDNFCDSNPCYTTGAVPILSYPSGNLATNHFEYFTTRSYISCSAGYSYGDDSQGIWVMELLRTACEDASHWRVEGYHGTGGTPWTEIEDFTCGSGKICDSSVAGYETTNSAYDFEDADSSENYPCRVALGNSCNHADADYANDCTAGLFCVDGTCKQEDIQCSVNGSIIVSAVVEGSSASDLYVRLNNASQGVTADGVLTMELSGADCDANQQVEVYCADNSTLCGVQQTQIDLNGDEDNLFFDCSLKCGSGSDLSVSNAESWAYPNGTVIVTITSEGITQNNVKVNISRQDHTGLSVDSEEVLVNVVVGSKVNASVTFAFLGTSDFVHVWIDTDDQVKNEDDTNNYLFRPAVKDTDVFLTLSIDETFSSVEPILEEYIGSFVNLVENESEADVILTVSSYSAYDLLVSDGQLGFSNSYTASVVETPVGEQAVVVVKGRRIEGVIAGVKRLVNARNTFLDTTAALSASYVDNYDILGITVMDQMHTNETSTYFNQPTGEQFQNLVRDILFDNNFEVSIKPVKTTNETSYGNETILRVKHVNTDFSPEYLSAVGISDTPVVFSGGIFSHLETWEDNGEGLASQMAQEGWDVWEIEMTGGPNTECDSCPNYHYQDLVDHYWPASIAGISEYSGKNKIHYVGHSNGCRAALSSLNEYSNTGKNDVGYYFDFDTGQYLSSDLPVYVVDKFFGLGCPATLNEEFEFTREARELNSEGIPEGDAAIARLNSSGSSHVFRAAYGGAATSGWWGIKKVGAYAFLAGGKPISLNLMAFYNSLGVQNDSEVNFTQINVSDMYLFAGTQGTPVDQTQDAPNDKAVPVLDILLIHSSISNPEKYLYYVDTDHGGLVENSIVHQKIKEEIYG